MSEKQYRDKIATVKKQQGTEEKSIANARSAAAKHRADAAKELARITARTSESMARMYRRNAANAESKAAREDAKVTAGSAKLGKLARDLATAEANLDREVRATTQREDAKRKADARAAERADVRRRQAEKSHAREVARLSSPTVRYVHEVRTVPAPKAEHLRVLYLTANPEQDLRTDAEVRFHGSQCAAAREPWRPQYRQRAVTDNRHLAITPTVSTLRKRGVTLGYTWCDRCVAKIRFRTLLATVNDCLVTVLLGCPSLVRAQRCRG